MLNLEKKILKKCKYKILNLSKSEYKPTKVHVDLQILGMRHALGFYGISKDLNYERIRVLIGN